MALKNFLVPDLIISPVSIRVIFILESPHTNELVHKHPLAGQAGVRLVNILKKQGFLNAFNCEQPLGCQIKNLKYFQLAIINASILPMSLSAYPSCLSEKDLLIVERLNKIKDKLEKKNLKENFVPKSKIENFLISNLSLRLTKILQQSTNHAIFIVPCGNVAAHILSVCHLSFPNLQIISNFPHPSSRKYQQSPSLNAISNGALP